MPTQETIPCPQCGQPTEVDLWQVLDLAREPALRHRFLQGEINALRCGNCGTNGMLPVPLAIHDPASEQVIFFIADDPQITPEILGQIQADLGNALMRGWAGPHPDYLFTPSLSQDLGEVAGLLAAGFDAQTSDVQTGSVSKTGPVSAGPGEPTPPPPSELIDALFSFINANSWPESQQIVEAHQDLLLSEQVESIFDELLEQYQSNAQAVQELQTHRALLRRCRDIGIPAAFAELAAALQQTNESGDQPFDIPSDLQPIINELSQLVQLSDMPRRVELCRQALTIVSRTDNEQLWAGFQGELGNSLAQNPLGSRSGNIEQAIAAYQQAVTVFTRTTFLEEWINIKNALGLAYIDRVEGQRNNNIEEAIGLYQEILEVCTHADFPNQWAMTQNNLANAYSNRIHEEFADNIEQAIHHYQQALKVYTRAIYPKEWAMAQNNLANAYLDRIEGDRADNIEKAIEAYQQALTIQTRKTMPVEWAQTVMNLANAYSDRILGNRAKNIERAIEAYQQTLTIRTLEEMPFKWADQMNNLANAYLDRIEGDRADNIEKAIEAYQQALTIQTRETMPVEWAELMNNIATAYLIRIKGKKSDNIEQAISILKQTLTIRTRKEMPIEWSGTMHNLATAYSDRILGNRAENIEHAIAVYRQALTVRTQQAMPIDWAKTMTNLADSYKSRIFGERADNIEQAISALEQVLTVITRKSMPIEWANTMNNLANVYLDRIRGDQADNIEQAIYAYEQALDVRTKSTLPLDWAQTMTNLANTYTNRILGEEADNIEQAIKACKQALTVRTQKTMPVQWAKTMTAMANAYANHVRGTQTSNTEHAISRYRQALRVFTRKAFPFEWATTQNNLATTYRKRVKGERIDNTRKAIFHYVQALKVRTIEKFPADHLKTQRNLGNLYFDERRWSEAQIAYNGAIEAGRALLAVAATDVGRRAEVAETAQLFARSAYCQVQQGQVAAALLTLEQGKTRLLTEALALSGANLALLPPAQQQAYQDAVEQVRSLEAELRLPPREDLTGFSKPVRSERDIIANLTQARADLNALIDTIRQEQPDFLPTGLDLEQLLSLIPPGGALVAPLITSQGSAVFVLPDGGAENVIARREAAKQSPAADGETASRPPVARSDIEYVLWLDEFTEDDLRAILIGTEEFPGWLRVYLENRSNLTAWFTAIEVTNDLLGQKLVAPIVDKLTALGVNPGAPLLLMPQGGLGLLPLHAASISPLPQGEGPGVRVKARALLDDYVISYAPSGYALHAARQRLESTPSQPPPVSRGRSQNLPTQRGGIEGGEGNLLAIVNPTGDLPFTPAEGDAVAALFEPGQVTRLDKEEATLEAVGHRLQPAACRWLHFSGHGFYNWDEAMQSGLVLADGNLTLSRLISRADLSRVRLVTLSACETGITEFRQSPDEFLGLPAGLMQAGAPAVVSTLWAVNDLSTMLLMERFYRHYLEDGLALPEALRQAQLWLRDVTAGELAERFAAAQQAHLEPAQRLPVGVAIDGDRRFRYDYEPDDRPFAHPFYWAAFTFSG